MLEVCGFGLSPYLAAMILDSLKFGRRLFCHHIGYATGHLRAAAVAAWSWMLQSCRLWIGFRGCQTSPPSGQDRWGGDGDVGSNHLANSEEDAARGRKADPNQNAEDRTDCEERKGDRGVLGTFWHLGTFCVGAFREKWNRSSAFLCQGQGHKNRYEVEQRRAV